MRLRILLGAPFRPQRCMHVAPRGASAPSRRWPVGTAPTPPRPPLPPHVAHPTHRLLWPSRISMWRSSGVAPTSLANASGTSFRHGPFIVCVSERSMTRVPGGASAV
jgi:hypothetical protein